ncbi:hypothetical protein KJ693_06605 [bacterium]|nr:hypothetical protein [bacterium]MBU1614971.1 hypothetical protein [bacterium]
MTVSGLGFSYGGWKSFSSNIHFPSTKVSVGNNGQEELATDVGRLAPNDPGIYSPYSPPMPEVKNNEISGETEDEIIKIKKQNPNMDIYALARVVEQRLGVDISSRDVKKVLKKQGEEKEDRKETGREAALGEKEGRFTEKEKEEVERLKERDQEIRRHEQTHIAMSGGNSKGAPYYEYETGPDGKRYAVNGHVDIEMSPGRTPEETIRKARAIQKGSLSPAEPSQVDRSVAQSARQMEQDARKEARAQRQTKATMNSEEETVVVREQGNPVNENDEAKETKIKTEAPNIKEEESSKELTEEEKKEVEKLKKRDQEVRQHEQTHIRASGGNSIGSPRYEYETGPDGKRYAVGGEVNIDMSKEDTPKETLQKAREIERGALAPSEPSSADRKVAQEARQMQREARQEIASEGREEDGTKAEEVKSLSPEIEKKIVEKKQENPGMDEEEIKKWLEETEGIDVSAEKIKKIVEEETANRKGDEEGRNFISGILSNIYNREEDALGQTFDLVA